MKGVPNKDWFSLENCFEFGIVGQGRGQSRSQSHTDGVDEGRAASNTQLVSLYDAGYLLTFISWEAKKVESQIAEFLLHFH